MIRCPAFLVSFETECLTVTDPRDICWTAYVAAIEFMRQLAELAPSLPGPSGLFNAFGRIYLDMSHIELAAAECNSPYNLVTIVEQQQLLIKQALEKLAQRGIHLTLANNNYDGLLRADASTWGTHGNYRSSILPKHLTDRFLPFLSTRIYAGSGGLHFPSARFLASPRVHFVDVDRGGGSTSQLAIHSTTRDEHLTSLPEQYGYRYHTVMDDGNRSHYSQALHFGTTLLVLHALTGTPHAPQPLPVSPSLRKKRSFWVRAARRFNVLAEPELFPTVHPLVLQIQRLYWELTRRYVDSLIDVPQWVDRLLEDWSTTLDAMELDDQDWLATHLDPWIKYRLWSQLLADTGSSWQEVVGNRRLASWLTLLDQQYHEFCNDDSPFTLLEKAGLLRHRVTPVIQPGSEAEPFVPQLGTRATARACFIKEHNDARHLEANWASIIDTSERQRWSLDDPFADKFSGPHPLPPSRDDDFFDFRHHLPF